MPRRWIQAAGLLAVPLVLLNLTCAAPLRAPTLRALDAPLVVDEHLALAARHAPVLFKAVDATRGRQDLPTRVDFDGDLRGDNNWEHMVTWSLPPTVSYAVLSTATHHFISYHLFHPRDWAPLRLGLHGTHENDGENLQVVVDRSTGEVILVYTQAHYDGRVHGAPEGPFGPGRYDLRGPLQLFDDEGRPAARGAHPGVFVESQGHGIYGLGDPCAEVEVGGDGAARFDPTGLVFRVARPGEAVAEPALDPRALAAPSHPASFVPYQLESLTAKLWPGLRDGGLVGPGGLLDGAVRFTSPRVEVDVPRYYEADRFSGPFGPDRGIAPFALDFGFEAGEVGALFFDPARRYAECLSVPTPWSLDYEDYPFGG